MRASAALLLMLTASVANSMPVSVSSGVLWIATTWTHMGNGEYHGGDPVSWNSSITEDFHWVNEFGYVDVSSHGEYNRSLVANDDHVSFDSEIVMNIQGEVSRGMPSDVYTLASMRAWDMIFQVNVYEPVIYSGSHTLSLDGRGDPIESGALLQPGRYDVNWYASDIYISYTAHRGETFDITTTKDFSLNFDRVPVPAPTTFGMLCLGLVGIVLSRRRVFSRARM